MIELLLIILASTLGPLLLSMLVNYIKYKFWPRAQSGNCRIVRENDCFSIYDDYFPKSVNPIGHIYIKNNKAEVHIRKTFEDDEIVDYEPIESWLLDEDVYKGCQVGIKGYDPYIGTLSFENLKNWFLSLYSMRDYRAILTVPVDEPITEGDDTKESETTEPSAPEIRKVFKIREYGHLKKDVENIFPMRKLLCGYLAIQDEIRERLDLRVADGSHKLLKPKWKETVFLAGVIFTILYVIAVNVLPYPKGMSLYPWLRYMAISIGGFALIWITLYEIHVEMSFKNTKFTQFLRLFNRCTGMKLLQRIYFALIAVGLYLSISYFKYVEYFVVMAFVNKFGRFNYNLWKVDDPLVPIFQKMEEDEKSFDDGADDPNPNFDLFAINSYHWRVSSMAINNEMILRLKFEKEKMRLLSTNYDNCGPLNSEGDPADAAKFFVDSEKQSLHVKKLHWFFDKMTEERTLTAMQRLQMIFNFVQDRDSLERIDEPLIANRLRSTEEILYSKKATAMDRAIVAATIYAAMDYRVNILQARDGRVALEVAESENVCKDLCGVTRNDVFSYNDAVYYVCDMQDDDFVIGTIPSFKKSDFIRRIVIA